MRGQRRASTPRSRPGMASPASTPHTTGCRRGSTGASTTPHPREIAPWASTPPAARAPGAASTGRRSVPAARTESKGERPVATACAVDGAPLSTPRRRRRGARLGAWTGPWTTMMRAAGVPPGHLPHASSAARGAAVPVLLPDHPLSSLDEYIDEFEGGQGLVRARELGPDGIVDTIERAGLRGRGGAGFPTGRKWASIL